MGFTKFSHDEIRNEKDYNNLEKNSKKKPGLNPDISLGLQEFEQIVYYKNPKIQGLVIACIAIPTLWFVFSAFGTPKHLAQKSQAMASSEAERVRAELAKEREKNHDLQIKNAIAEEENQKSEITTFDSLPKPDPPEEIQASKPLEKPKPPVTRVVVAEPKPRPKPEVEIDPMEKWLEVSNRGRYVAATVTDNQPSTISPPSRVTENKTKEYPLYEDRVLAKNLNSPEAQLLTQPFGGRREFHARKVSRPPNTAQNSARIRSDEKTIDIGSSTEAVLVSSVAWTNNRSSIGDRKKYLLELEQGWKNLAQEEVLPKGTRAIAQVTERDSSGLFSMEVIEFLIPEEKNGKTIERKIKVPTELILIEGEDGSPLKAERKQKGDSNLAKDLGRIVAPGIERAFDDVADSAETIILGEDDVLRTRNRSNNPLAGGISGIADGANSVFNRRLSRTNSDDSTATFFQFDSGKKVKLTVFNDFSI